MTVKTMVKCSICDEETVDFFICDGCHEAVCIDCSHEHMHELGNGTDDIIYLCSTCKGMK